MDFRKYLEKKGYKAKTQGNYGRYIGSFSRWFLGSNKEEKAANYQDILNYIKSRKERKQSVSYINSQLGVLQLYFDFLNVKNNPVADLRLKGNSRKLPHSLLSEKQLNELYLSWKTESSKDFKEREMIGFLVYQGLKTGEIARLKTLDIDFEKGEVFIKGTAKTNTRKLPLKANQAMNLQKFIQEIRTLESDFLFTKTRFIQLNNDFHQRLRLDFETATLTLRSSVICNWLKQFNLREVQYKSGHKYVSSTEKYQQVNVQDLQEAVLKFHPI